MCSLQKKIEELQSRLEEKEIIIEALIEQIKIFKSTFQSNVKQTNDTGNTVASTQNVHQLDRNRENAVNLGCSNTVIPNTTNYDEFVGKDIEGEPSNTKPEDIDGNYPNINEYSDIAIFGHINDKKNLDPSKSSHVSNCALSKQLDTCRKTISDSYNANERNLSSCNKGDTKVINEDKNFHNEVQNIFKTRKQKKFFNSSLSPVQFLEVFSYDNSFTLESKKPTRHVKHEEELIVCNIEQLIATILYNINDLPLDKICRSLWGLSQYLKNDRKLYLAHDIVVLVSNFSKVPFFIAALFNNSFDYENVLGQTINAILYRQYTIDTQIYAKDAFLVSQFTKIKDNLGLHEKKSIEELCQDLTKCDSVIEDGEIKKDVILQLYALRIICHYLDWDYTYNTLIRGNIYFTMEKDKNAYAGLCIGILCFNALRLFGRVESVDALIKFLEKWMVDDSELAIVCYLFVKQVNLALADDWIEKNSISLAGKNYSIPYLKRLVLF